MIDIPKEEKVENIKQKTPKGESHITKLTIFSIISFKSKKKDFTFDVSLESLFKPYPNNMAKIIIWIILPSAIALIGLLGNKFTKVSFKEGIAFCSNDDVLVRLASLAISKKELTNKALTIASAVVNKYSPIAFELIERSCLSEVRFETPTTKDTKTKGTTNNFNKDKKILPIASTSS